MELYTGSGNSVNLSESSLRLEHRTVLKIVGFENRDITNILHFPASRRELLDLLQVKLVVFSSRIEIKAVFPIEPVNCQKCTPFNKGRGECR